MLVINELLVMGVVYYENPLFYARRIVKVCRWEMNVINSEPQFGLCGSDIHVPMIKLVPSQ